MSELVLVNFRSAKAAFAAGEALARHQGGAGTEPDDIVVVTRDAKGRIGLNQSIDQATGKTLAGGQWGMVIGLLCAGSGAMANRKLAQQFQDSGLPRDFLAEMDRSPPKSGAAVGMRARHLAPEAVVALLAAQPGAAKVLRAALDAVTEAKLMAIQTRVPAEALAHLNAGVGD